MLKYSIEVAKNNISRNSVEVTEGGWMLHDEQFGVEIISDISKEDQKRTKFCKIYRKRVFEYWRITIMIILKRILKGELKFRIRISGWRLWLQFMCWKSKWQIPPKSLYISTRLYGFTTRKILSYKSVYLPQWKCTI